MQRGAGGVVAPRFGWGRYPRAVGYTILTGCGIVLIVAPAPVVRTSTYLAAVYVWAAFLVVGGALSALGAGLDRWMGEYVGLWPIMSAFAVWALAALARPNAFPFGLLMVAITLLLFARWRHVARVHGALRKVPDRVRHER